jgi:hypothetical protein
MERLSGDRPIDELRGIGHSYFVPAQGWATTPGGPEISVDEMYEALDSLKAVYYQTPPLAEGTPSQTQGE